MIRETLRKIYRAFADGLGGFKDAILDVIPKKKKKEDEEDAELEWWEDKPKDKKPSLRDKINKLMRRTTTGPRPLPGSRRLKRIVAALSLLVYIGIVIFMLGENPVVEVFFVLTVYIMIDYLAITREKDIWSDKRS